jgi:hypothetical protein
VLQAKGDNKLFVQSKVVKGKRVKLQTEDLLHNLKEISSINKATSESNRHLLCIYDVLHNPQYFQDLQYTQVVSLFDPLLTILFFAHRQTGLNHLCK